MSATIASRLGLKRRSYMRFHLRCRGRVAIIGVARESVFDSERVDRFRQIGAETYDSISLCREPIRLYPLRRSHVRVWSAPQTMRRSWSYARPTTAEHGPDREIACRSATCRDDRFADAAKILRNEPAIKKASRTERGLSPHSFARRVSASSAFGWVS